ncbi:tetratricopeptide repeat-containing sensor histidine kinase [Flavobacterium acetivorans]|uniref:ATP-binding protein n=1 Tax=Flavobacterium acetivorans TaxID=2893883 RepID=UPI001E5B1A69|nr:tetratricopeptide repeat-containing sensor histidine kinase [Flavobacterium sp. F-29]UFH36917.1 ATP-binding protein [Flavobacterium sp. F-29]
MGYKHYQNTKLDSSYYYFNQAKQESIREKDTSRIIHSIAWMAQIHIFSGDYSGGEATAVEALPFIENTNKYPNGKWNIYNALGNNYLYTADHDHSLYYFNKALSLKTDPIEKISTKSNIALVYIDQNKFHNAIKILLPLTLKKELSNNPEIYARLLDNLGYSYFKTANPKAFNYLNQSLKIRLRILDNWGLMASYYHLSEYYNKSHPKLATDYALLTYKKATEIKSIDDRLKCLELLIKNSPSSQSKKHSLQYLHINDSVNKARQKMKNQFAKIKYDSKKEKDENIKLKEQKILLLEQEKNKNLLFYFIVTIGFLTTLFITYFLVAKNKREKIQTSYNTEIRIAKKLHDELANDVYHAMTFAETQDLSTSQNKEILLTNLDTIYSRTRNISKENSNIETGSNFVSTLKELIASFNTNEVNILVNGIDSTPWTKIENNKKIIIYRVLQELLVNMKKHSQCNLAVITFKKNEDKLQIDYTDNGVGAVLDKRNKRNGLQNVENRILSINGTINFDTKSHKGFKTSFALPI